LGSTGKKAARRTLMKLTPEAQFPLAVPPFAAHSLAVKQDPIITLVDVDEPKVHCLFEKLYHYLIFKNWCKK